MIGDDEPASQSAPIFLGDKVIQLSSGDFHSCGLLDSSDGIKCWGNGSDGALGYGNINNLGDTELPGSATLVDLGGPVSQIAAGGTFTCALLQNQDIRCWGDNFEGQLGNATNLNIVATTKSLRRFLWSKCSRHKQPSGIYICDK